MPQGAQQGNPMLLLIVEILIFGLIFYFLLIRPQKKREKQFKLLLEELKVGDEIITIGGMFGKITKIKDDKVYFETSAQQGEKVIIPIYKWGIKDVKQKEKA